MNLAGELGRFRSLRATVAAVLLFAAVNKTYALAISDSRSYASFQIPAWALYASVVVEWILGVWLVLGAFAYAAWLCSLICFSVFFWIALSAALSGAETCGCFGFLSTSPWLTALMDASIIAALLVFQAMASGVVSKTVVAPHSAIRTASLFTVFATASVVFASGIRAQLEAARFTSATELKDVDTVESLPDPAIVFSAAGISPTSMPLHALSMEQIVNAAISQYGLAAGAFESVSPEDVLAGFDVNDPCSSPIVFRDKQRHVMLALGLFSEAGEDYYQLLSGNGPPFLVPSSELNPLAIENACRVKSKGDGVTVTFGRARLKVDKLCKNFGIVRPASTVTTEFKLANEGDEVILILGKPQTSCGCTVADIGSTPVLKARESLLLNVSLSTGNRNVRETVRLALQDSDSGEKFPLELQLLASHLASMAIVPAELDFGPVSRGETVTRMLRLSEVDNDRFNVKSVDVGALPVSHTLDEKQNADGLRDHYVRLRLTPTEIHFGEHAGTITVATDSRQLPFVKVPIKFKVRSNLEAASPLGVSLNMKGQ